MPKTATLSKDTPLADRWKIGVAMALVMLAAIALRLYNLGGPSLWYDEFLTVSIASGPLENIPQAVKIGEQTPPLSLRQRCLGDRRSSRLWPAKPGPHALEKPLRSLVRSRLPDPLNCRRSSLQSVWAGKRFHRASPVRPPGSNGSIPHRRTCLRSVNPQTANQDLVWSCRPRGYDFGSTIRLHPKRRGWGSNRRTTLTPGIKI